MVEFFNWFTLLVRIRVWTGGQWVQWETRPLHVQGNPLHLRKFPLHFQTCLKVGFKTSPAILFSKKFYGNFSKKSKFLAKFWKTQKIKYFVEKGFKLWHKMFMKAKPRLSYCFCKVKCAKSQHFSFAGGFAGTPSLAVGLFYTCILQGARQVQGPCCTNPSCWEEQKRIVFLRWGSLISLPPGKSMIFYLSGPQTSLI